MKNRIVRYLLALPIVIAVVLGVGCSSEFNGGDSLSFGNLENSSSSTDQKFQSLSSNNEKPHLKWKARFFIVHKDDSSHYLDSTAYKAKGRNRIKVIEKARSKCESALEALAQEDPETFAEGKCDQQPPEAVNNVGTDTDFSCISTALGQAHGYCKGTRETCEFPPLTYEVNDEPGPNCTFSPGRQYWRDGNDSVTVDGCCEYHATIKYYLW